MVQLLILCVQVITMTFAVVNVCKNSSEYPDLFRSVECDYTCVNDIPDLYTDYGKPL